MLTPVTAKARRFFRRVREAFASRSAKGALGRRLVALVSAVLLLSGALGAGRSYLWCSMMEEAVEACCCDPAREGDETRTSEIRAACCEDHAIGEITKARVVVDTIAVPDALPATIAVAEAISPIAIAPPFAAPRSAPAMRGSPIRAGPNRAVDTCVRLQVFRC